MHPKLVVVTGMTRDGLFLVEGGRITAPVRNLRFTQSYLEALAGVEAVGGERRGPARLPGHGRSSRRAHRRFSFTGTTVDP